MSDNLYDFLAACFPPEDNAPALILPGPANSIGKVVTYGDLAQASARLANKLVSLGIEAGDRVAVQVEKSPLAVMLYLACLRAGAIYLPLNTAYTDAEVDYFLNDATPAAVVLDPARLGGLRKPAYAAGARHVLGLDTNGTGTLTDDLETYRADFATVPREPDDIAAILYTSGTTGRSKGAMLTHLNLSSNARALHTLWGWQPDDVLLHALPIFHVHGLFVALHCAFLSGCRTIFLPKFEAEQFRAYLPHATVVTAVPTFYTRLLALKDFGAEDCINMRLFTSGSAPLLEETFNEFQRRTGHTILERYGMTELGMVTSNPLDGERIPGTVGLPMPDNVVRVADDEGHELPDGEIGVLEVKGVNVFKGYWQMPEKTRSEFREDGFFITGDLSVREPNGYIRIVGRSKDLIISGGYNVYPREIEAFLDDIDGVLESAVVAAPHDDFGEVPVAYIVRTDPSLSEETIIAAAREKLAGFKVPRTIIFVDALPRNTMGKVQKNELRQRLTA